MDEGARLLSECGVNSLTVGSNPTLSANIQFLCFWIIVYHYNRKFKKLRKQKGLSLDSRSQEIKREIISVGSLNASLVHPREVFEPAVRNLAAQIILAHNHPSGDPEPSEDDITITKRLIEAGKIMGIEVVDHIIVVKNGFFSFKEKGLLEQT